MRRHLPLIAALAVAPAPAMAADPKMLVYAGINFTLYVTLLFVLLRKPLREFIAGRATSIEAEMRRVADQRKALEDRIDGLKARKSQLDAETSTIKEEAARIAAEQAARIEADGAKQAADIAAATELRVAGLDRDLQRELLAVAAEELVARARKQLGEKVDVALDERLARHGMHGLEAAR